MGATSVSRTSAAKEMQTPSAVLQPRASQQNSMFADVRFALICRALRGR